MYKYIYIYINAQPRTASGPHHQMCAYRPAGDTHTFNHEVAADTHMFLRFL